MESRSQVFRTRNLPAVVLAVVLVGEQVELSLQVLKILHFARLLCMQQVFLLTAIEGDGNDVPAALLQAGCGSLQIVMIAKEEVVVQGIRVGERLVDFSVSFRAAWRKSKKPANAFKHIFA